ncbi:hypothetical protein [Serinicoccus sediminis]|uniref:hypothetical protein n=1 Tax=Serinicoccus sediminis TaxID=2306021 RepID=UPI0010216F3D|nr:hypothetical protein [Serinicoccus sediminis]
MSTPARTVTAVGLGGVAAFQLALALGAPWGRASYGGQHEGVLPQRLRMVSAGAVVAYAALAVTVASERTSPQVRRGVLTAVAGLMSVAAVPNAISRSRLERTIWTPTTLALAYAAWRARDTAAG